MAAPKPPVDYTDDLGAKIVDLLSEGVPLKAICAMKGMPHYITVLRWQRIYEDFGNLSAQAKVDGTHALADQAIMIADDTTIDPAHKRVMVDTRIRLIGKWNSRAYGDKLAVDGKLGLTVVLDSDADKL